MFLHATCKRPEHVYNKTVIKHLATCITLALSQLKQTLTSASVHGKSRFLLFVRPPQLDSTYGIMYNVNNVVHYTIIIRV